MEAQTTSLQEIPMFPGVPCESKQLDQVLRVDLAGEQGAKRIYQGQLWALSTQRYPTQTQAILHMYQQEQAHAQAFEELCQKHHVRPTALSGVWYVAGFMLGAMSAALGPKAAMACTVAVEDVIDTHYQDQIQQIQSTLPAIAAFLEQCRQDEVEHKNQGYAYGAKEMPFASSFMSCIKGLTKIAIVLSKRI